MSLALFNYSTAEMQSGSSLVLLFEHNLCFKINSPYFSWNSLLMIDEVHIDKAIKLHLVSTLSIHLLY